jgi:hypothetical protein
MIEEDLLELSNTYQPPTTWKSLDAQRSLLCFYAELQVEYSLADVWSYFSDLVQWNRWSPVCRACRLEGDGLQLGSVLVLSFAILGITITVPCRVVEFDPPGLIAWQGEKFGIRATHRYRFVSFAEGTLLSNEEIFTGLSSPAKELVSAWYRASKLSEASARHRSWESNASC